MNPPDCPDCGSTLSRGWCESCQLDRLCRHCDEPLDADGCCPPCVDDELDREQRDMRASDAADLECDLRRGR